MNENMRLFPIEKKVDELKDNILQETSVMTTRMW